MKDHPGEGDAIDICCFDHRRFKKMDDDLLIGITDTLETAAADLRAGVPGMTQGLFAELQKSLGWKYNPDGLIFDRELRVVRWHSTLRCDWVHDKLQAGTMALEIRICCMQCGKAGIPFRTWGELLKCNWQYPKHRGILTRQLHELFNKYGEEYDT